MTGEYKYTSPLPEVYSSLQIDRARFFELSELTEFLDAVAWHVTTDGAENSSYINARQHIQSALTQTLWDNYRISEFDDWMATWEEWPDEQKGELTVSFHGTAFFYINRRDAPARPGSRQR